MMQKRLLGILVGWDPQTRMLRVRFAKWWETGRPTEAEAPFLLDDYAIVTSAHRGILALSELAVGQRIALTYVTGAAGYPIANVLAITQHSKAARAANR